jgi:ribonucleoside-diphosphate reductase alpha chain
VSVSLQAGVPLKTLVRKFKDMSFAPAGFTNTADIPMAKSIMDYVFRYLGTRFLDTADREELFGPDSGPMTGPQIELVTVAPSRIQQVADAELQSAPKPHNHAAVGAAPAPHALTATNADAPVCQCGTLMFKAGSCYSCPNCFATTGVCN